MSPTDLIHSWAASLQSSSVGTAVSAGALLFPICETVHVAALALVIGTISIVDLRLLGLASMKRPVKDLTRQLLPLTWIGFAIALVSGALMFSANATRYVDIVYFQLKFGFLGLAALNMLVFHLLIWRSVDAWDTAPAPPLAAKLAGGVSLGCWISIVFLGRWVGFVT
jgi:hypothetical protein